MFKSWVLNSWTLSSISFGNTFGVRTSYVCGTVGDGMAKLEKKGGVCLARQLFEIPRVAFPFFLPLRSYLISDVNALLAPSHCGLLPQHPPSHSTKAAKRLLAFRGLDDEMIQRHNSHFEVFHYIPYINELFLPARWWTLWGERNSWRFGTLVCKARRG